MFSIQNDPPISHTCCVCSKPINPIAGVLPPLPGLGPDRCAKCGGLACAEHIGKLNKICKKCSGIKDWCGTIDPLSM